MHAETVGAAKPDPTMLLTACKALRVLPSECRHVGDSPVRDVEMAHAAGADAVLYDPLACLDPDGKIAPARTPQPTPNHRAVVAVARLRDDGTNATWLDIIERNERVMSALLNGARRRRLDM